MGANGSKSSPHKVFSETTQITPLYIFFGKGIKCPVHQPETLEEIKACSPPVLNLKISQIQAYINKAQKARITTNEFPDGRLIYTDQSPFQIQNLKRNEAFVLRGHGKIDITLSLHEKIGKVYVEHGKQKGILQGKPMTFTDFYNTHLSKEPFVSEFLNPNDSVALPKYNVLQVEYHKHRVYTIYRDTPETKKDSDDPMMTVAQIYDKLNKESKKDSKGKKHKKDDTEEDETSDSTTEDEGEQAYSRASRRPQKSTFLINDRQGNNDDDDDEPEKISYNWWWWLLGIIIVVIAIVIFYLIIRKNLMSSSKQKVLQQPQGGGDDNKAAANVVVS